jgi:hypothetical protein
MPMRIGQQVQTPSHFIRQAKMVRKPKGGSPDLYVPPYITSFCPLLQRNLSDCQRQTSQKPTSGPE